MKRIAIVHDYLIDFGGAERVLLALHEIYPEAPIYVLIYRKASLGHFGSKFDDARVIQSWFGRLPFADKIISPLRFLIPGIWKSINLKEYDLIISSSSWAVAKGFDKKPGEKEICYCHTPPRYLYGYDTSRKFAGLMGKLVKIYGSIVNRFMRKYDFKRAQKVDYFIANSQEVAGRIQKFYHRDSAVIYPPIEIPDSRFQIPNSKNYFLAGGRLVASKNFDLIIKTFNKLGLPLKFYGSGPACESLKEIAGPSVEILGRVSDEELSELYAGALAYVLAEKDEDFGMTPVEAMGFGTPVIAYRGGGYLESIVEGKTGVFFDELTVESLSDAIQKFEKMKFNSEDCITQARKFSSVRFKKEIKEFVGVHTEQG
jgi:glycosyltransferase involved in cell wall biosynthesis